MSADAQPGIDREAVRDDHAVEVVDRGDAEPDLGHRSELVQGDRLASPGALQALHRVLVSARDPVEHRDEIACFGISFLDRDGEQRPREGAFLDMGALDPAHAARLARAPGRA